MGIKSEANENELIQKIKDRYSKQLKIKRGWVLLTSIVFVAYSLFVVMLNSKMDLKVAIVNPISALELLGYILLLTIWMINQRNLDYFKDIKESIFIRYILMDQDSVEHISSKYTTRIEHNAKIVKILNERSIRVISKNNSNGVFTIEKNKKKVNDNVDYIIFITDYGQIGIEIKE